MRKRFSGMIKGMKRVFENLSIRSKFISVCVPIIIVLVALILVASNSVLYRSNIEKAKEIAQDECEIMNVRLDSMKENVITCSNMLAQDINRIYSETNITNIDNISFISIKNNIYTALDYDRRCFSDIESILFIDTKRNISSVGIKQTPDYDSIQRDFISAIPEKGLAKCVQFPMEKRDYFNNQEPVLTFGKRIINMETGKILGYILLNINESRISAIFPEKEGEVLGREYFLSSDKGQIVSSINKDRLLNNIPDGKLRSYLQEQEDGSENLGIGKNQYLVTKKWIKSLEWNLVSQISIEDLTRDVRMTTGITIALGISGILAAVFLIFILSKLITRPIYALTKAAEKIQDGDFSISCPADTKDEVGVLSMAFNTMTGKIAGLLVQVKTEQKRKREYELALIQAQIKPHFLYNTLDLIYVFCECDMASKGAKLTKSLADYYRTSLSSGKEIITIRDEIKNIENYLFIQRERYCDLIDFQVHCDPKIEDYSILKMTLQPLVENAIYHGLKEKGIKGTIRIWGRLEETAAVIVVEDDGAGMTDERIRQVVAKDEPEHKRHFGLRSVDKRIKLYFGESYGIHIDSVVNKGTKVMVYIPKTGGRSC
ncbi:sensor histidine kinase [uncultured Robinsoniella sp.]|uniref:sensor histidine kinase n=1 Tax=uncultured Robinsoniella sp. TaxID=904190 RepID=UPI00374F1CEE